MDMNVNNQQKTTTMKHLKNKTMKQTAMQELWDYIDANYHEENFNLYSAKKLSIKKEKEQIINAYDKGEYDCGCNGDAHQYYNETFKK